MLIKSNEADVVVLRFKERLEMVERWVVLVKINTFGLLTFNFHVLHSSSTNLWMYITPLSPPPLSGVLELLMLTHLCVFFSRGRPAGASRSRGWKYVLGDVHGDQSGRDKVRPEFTQIPFRASIRLPVSLYLIIHLSRRSLLRPRRPVSH